MLTRIKNSAVRYFILAFVCVVIGVGAAIFDSTPVQAECGDLPLCWSTTYGRCLVTPGACDWAHC